MNLERPVHRRAFGGGGPNLMSLVVRQMGLVESPVKTKPVRKEPSPAPAPEAPVAPAAVPQEQPAPQPVVCPASVPPRSPRLEPQAAPAAAARPVSAPSVAADDVDTAVVTAEQSATTPPFVSGFNGMPDESMELHDSAELAAVAATAATTAPRGAAAPRARATPSANAMPPGSMALSGAGGSGSLLQATSCGSDVSALLDGPIRDPRALLGPARGEHLGRGGRSMEDDDAVVGGSERSDEAGFGGAGLVFAGGAVPDESGSRDTRPPGLDMDAALSTESQSPLLATNRPAAAAAAHHGVAAAAAATAETLAGAATQTLHNPVAALAHDAAGWARLAQHQPPTLEEDLRQLSLALEQLASMVPEGGAPAAAGSHHHRQPSASMEESQRFGERSQHRRPSRTGSMAQQQQQNRPIVVHVVKQFEEDPVPYRKPQRFPPGLTPSPKPQRPYGGGHGGGALLHQHHGSIRTSMDSYRAYSSFAGDSPSMLQRRPSSVMEDLPVSESIELSRRY